jgi:hypothetical protein
MFRPITLAAVAVALTFSMQSFTPEASAQVVYPTYRSTTVPTYRTYRAPSTRFIPPSNLGQVQQQYRYGTGIAGQQMVPTYRQTYPTFQQTYPQYVVPNQPYSTGFRGTTNLPYQPYGYPATGYDSRFYGTPSYGTQFYGTPGQQRGAAIGGAIGDALGGQQSGNIGAAIGGALGGR